MSDKVKGVIFFASLVIAGVLEIIFVLSGNVVPAVIVPIVELLVSALTGHNFIWPKRPNTIRNVPQ